MYDNSFEKAPGSVESKGEREIPPEEDFADSFAKDVPEFAGEQFGTAHENNDFYGEASGDDAENEGIADAASIINYGLDAIAREKGVEAVVQGIKSFDANGSDNPIRDLYTHLGINNPEELHDVQEESSATEAARISFRNEYDMPKSQKKTREGALKAIADMKELIAEVEGADPRYEELRNAARGLEKGYFEYAVKDYGSKGLTELFSELAQQKEISEGDNTEEQEEDEGEEANPEQS